MRTKKQKARNVLPKACVQPAEVPRWEGKVGSTVLCCSQRHYLFALI